MEKRKTQMPVVDLTSIVYAGGTEEMSVEDALRELRCIFLWNDDKVAHLRAEVCLAEVLENPDVPRVQTSITLSALNHPKAYFMTPFAEEVLESFTRLETDPRYAEIFYEANQLR